MLTERYKLNNRSYRSIIPINNADLIDNKNKSTMHFFNKIKAEINPILRGTPTNKIAPESLLIQYVTGDTFYSRVSL